MGWVQIRIGGSLTDGTDREFSRDVPSNADAAAHAEAFFEAHAFLVECEEVSKTYNAAPAPAVDTTPETA